MIRQERVSERMGVEIVAVERIVLPERWKRAGGEPDFWAGAGFDRGLGMSPPLWAGTEYPLRVSRSSLKAYVSASLMAHMWSP